MAYEIPALMHTLESTGDSTGDQYKIVVATSSGGYSPGLAVVATRGGPWTGVLQEYSTEVGARRIMSLGISKVQAGDSSAMATGITIGSEVVASSQGQAVPSSSDGMDMVGIALESLSTGSTGIISVMLTPGAKTTT